MPWCPKCQNEFVDGVTHCNDCGEPLVEQLQTTDIETAEIADIEMEYNETETTDNDPMEIGRSSTIESSFDSLDPLNPLNSPLAAFIRPSESPLYTKASDRKEEYSSSSFSFLIVALITFILGIFIYSNIIDLTAQPNARIKYMLILLFITLLFIILAFFSNRKSKIISQSVDQEEQQLQLIVDYIKQQLDTPLESNYLSLDELYFARNEWLLLKLKEYDPNFSDAYLDYLSEYLYQELFEN